MLVAGEGAPESLALTQAHTMYLICMSIFYFCICMGSGGLDVVPVDLPAVVLAGKAVGTYINVDRKVHSQRLMPCPLSNRPPPFFIAFSSIPPFFYRILLHPSPSSLTRCPSCLSSGQLPGHEADRQQISRGERRVSWCFSTCLTVS